MLKNSLLEKYSPYCLVCYNKDSNDFYYEVPIVDFLKERHKGVWEFFIVSKSVSPNYELFDNKDDRLDYLRYLSLNGCLSLLHGRIVKGIIDESAFMCIDKYAKINNPDKIYYNLEYLEIYEALIKSLKKILKYRSKLIWLDGRVSLSKTKMISEEFAKGLKNGNFKAKIEL